ncbi:MAG: outer membrane beta-barrel protein [Bacteroidales bacterium]
MTRCIITICLLFSLKNLFAQLENEKRVNIFFGQVFSSISYRNSQGQTDSYLNAEIKSTYGVWYQRFFNKLVFIQPTLYYINLGAQSTVNNQKVEWDFHYLGLSVGAGVGRTRKFIHSDFIFKPYGTLSIYAQYPYKADQTIGEQYVNLLKDNEFRNFDSGIRLTAGCVVDFSQDIALDIAYTFLRSLINLEKQTQTQKMYNQANIFSFGLVVKL